MSTKKMQNKLKTELTRYRDELLQLNVDIESARGENYQYWCELQRRRDSVNHAIQCTEMQLSHTMRYTGIVGSMASGIEFIEVTI